MVHPLLSDVEDAGHTSIHLSLLPREEGDGGATFAMRLTRSPQNISLISTDFVFHIQISFDIMSQIDPATGLRADVNERPELLRGCVEFVAPSEYMVRAPQPPVYFFMIDVCYAAISSGMLKTTIDVRQKCIIFENLNSI